ncbi:ABC transporter permease [Metabacillus litoralis]|uniref:ABC transporter permease n=1 Tax=Metabacillus TaxID=2675233 RepID=UPI001C572B69|nr:ABC transporter permease [Metabacillus litoralis]MCM3161438.1 ABC transporter permease [Metabacillus litoralis]
MDEKTVVVNNSRKSQSMLNLNLNFLLKISLPLILLLMWLVITLIDPVFISFNNLTNLGRQTAIIAIVAIGQTFVIITKGIDLSVGSTLGLSCVVSALLLVSGIPIMLTIIVVTVIGIVIGLINGLIIYDMKITPFIATLGMMTMVRGATLLSSDGEIVSGMPRSFTRIANSEIFGIPYLILILVAICIIFMCVLRFTVFGRNLFAIGSSDEAALLSGVNVRMTTYGAYMISGGLSALAGILMTSRLASGVPTAGQMYELDAIASAVIGGASLFGAQGSVIGTVFGSFIMTTLRNAGNLLGIEPFWLQIAIGALLVIVVFFDQLQKKRG